ncbi:MAG: metallophosphoesterase [Pyrinomonadaceae bacterium]
MDESVALLFVAVVAGIYLFAALAIIRLALRRLRLIAEPTRGALLAERLAIALAAVGLVCIAYGYFVEPYRLAVTHVRAESPKLPHGSRPVRVVHISDLHSDPKPRLEGRLPDVIAAEHPDLIVFTGDSINSPAGLPVFRDCLTRLARVAPTFVVKGNWDAWYWSGQQLFEGTGARELKDEAVRFDAAGTPIWIAGVPVGDERQLGSTLDTVPPGAFTIFLYHYPDLIDEVAARKVDLYCAGHTHGGQVALPFYGALVTLSKFGKKYEAGLYHVGETWLYVNRGVGMEGGSAPRVRFWARPEVTVIDIVPMS